MADAKPKPLDNHGAQAEPLDNVNANLDCAELLDSDGQNAQAVPLDDVAVPLGDDLGAQTRPSDDNEHLGIPTPLHVDAPLAEDPATPRLDSYSGTGAWSETFAPRPEAT